MSVEGKQDEDVNKTTDETKEKNGDVSKEEKSEFFDDLTSISC